MKTGMKLKLLYNYLSQKVSFASLVTLQKCQAGQIVPNEVWSTALKNVFTGKMIYFYRYKGSEMNPTISAEDTLIVRKLPCLNAGVRQQFQQIRVGDVIIFKDPVHSDNHVVRRVAAVEGHQMVSKNEEDEPFVIENGQFWVLFDNKNLKPKEGHDSRTYGPISTTDIVGRVIYRFRTLQDNGFVVNNKLSMKNDMPILYVELDSTELHHFVESEGKSKGS